MEKGKEKVLVDWGRGTPTPGSTLGPGSIREGGEESLCSNGLCRAGEGGWFPELFLQTETQILDSWWP